MKTFAIMIIWFGAGHGAQFDAERFDTIAECEAALAVVKNTLDRADVWGGDVIKCFEVQVIDESTGSIPN